MKLKTVLKKIETRLQEIKGNRRQVMHNTAVMVLQSKLQLVEHLVEIYKKIRLNTVDNGKKIVLYMEFILECITRDDDRLTAQEIYDIQNEITRFNRMIHLLAMTELPTFEFNLRQHRTAQLNYEKAKACIFGILPFTKEIDEQVCWNLCSNNESRSITTQVS